MNTSKNWQWGADFVLRAARLLLAAGCLLRMFRVILTDDIQHRSSLWVRILQPVQYMEKSATWPACPLGNSITCDRSVATTTANIVEHSFSQQERCTALSTTTSWYKGIVGYHKLVLRCALDGRRTWSTAEYSTSLQSL